MSTSSPAASSSTTSRSQLGSIAIIGALFFIFGFVTWLNGPLITFARLAFDLNEVDAFLILTAFFLSYFFLAIPSSWILKRTGMKKGLALGLFTMAVGAALFSEFCTQRWYPGALGGLFVIGGGLALLQTAVNPYISILGSIESAAQRIALMGIFNKIGGFLAPMVIGMLVMQGIGELSAKVAAADVATKEQLLDAFATRIHMPYLVIAGLLALFAIGILFSPLPEIDPKTANASRVADDASGTGSSIFRFPHLWLGALCIFAYVGAEVMAGDAIGTYGAAFGLPLDEAKFFTSFTLGAMLLGYVAGLLAIPKFVSQQDYLKWSTLLGVLLAIGAFSTTGYVSVGFVAALGFANAMMWPAIFPLAIKGLGRHTELGSALLVMGIVGGAIIPRLFAGLKQEHDFQLVFLLLMVPCYLYILFFAVRGHRVGRG